MICIICKNEFKSKTTGIYCPDCRYYYPLESKKALKYFKIKHKEIIICNDCNKKKHLCELRVHHIDFNILNNNDKNFVLLCPSCHSKRHSKRFKELKKYAKNIKVQESKKNER
jgi:hypothetical protein